MRIIIVLFVVPILLSSAMFAQAQVEALQQMKLPGPKDFIEADSATFTSEGKWEIAGNILLHLESLFEGAIIEVSASKMTFDEKNLLIEVPSEVEVNIPTFGVKILGINLIVNGTDKSGSLKKISGEFLLPKELFIEETGLVDMRFVRFLEGSEPKLKLRNGELEFFLGEDGMPRIRFTGAEFSSSASDKPDFLLKVKELLYVPNRSVSFRNLRITASGLTILYIPRLKRRAKEGFGLLGDSSILPGSDVEDGFYVLFSNFIDKGNFHADVYNKYFLERGVWSEGFFYYEPNDDTRIGFSVGRSRKKDKFIRTVGEGKEFDFFFRGKLQGPIPQVSSTNFGINFGRIKQDNPKVASTRGYIFGELTSKPIVIGKKSRAIVASSAHYYKYDYGDMDFLALRHRVKVANETAYGLDFFEFIHSDKFGSSPFRFEDAFPENQLLFQKNIAPAPRFTARIFGNYNYDLQRFDNLALGVAREFDSYYGGLYYDFARGSIGFETALKF